MPGASLDGGAGVPKLEAVTPQALPTVSATDLREMVEARMGNVAAVARALSVPRPTVYALLRHHRLTAWHRETFSRSARSPRRGVSTRPARSGWQPSSTHSFHLPTPLRTTRPRVSVDSVTDVVRLSGR